MTEHIQHLLACIDDGDRDALWPLVDAMLLAGDERAEGVRWLAEHGRWRLVYWEHEQFTRDENGIPTRILCEYSILGGNTSLSRSEAMLLTAQAVVNTVLAEVKP